MGIVVEPVDITVPPHLSASERGVSVALQTYLMHRIFCQDVTLAATSLDVECGEVIVKEYLLDARSRLMCHLYHLCFAVRIDSKVHHTAVLSALRNVILPVAGT